MIKRNQENQVVLDLGEMATNGPVGGGLGLAVPPSVPDHELICRVGAGSYGEVWLARSALQALRAVKVVYRGSFDNERPYEREFQGLLNFEPLSRAHDGLVDILQVGRNDEKGFFYYVMELADSANGRMEDGSGILQGTARMEAWGSGKGAEGNGEILELSTPEYVPLTLETMARQKGRLPARQCVSIALNLALALDYLHQGGLVHRDVKPSNIIFVNGVPKLADVGLVAKAETGKSFVGTEGFVPPEGPGTAQADIYSLGKVLYEIAMGKDRLAFPSPPTFADGLPDRELLMDLNEIILKACDPNPKSRYRSAKEMAEDLQILAAGESLRKLRHEQTQRRRKRGFGLALVILGISAGWGCWSCLREDPRFVERKPFTLANNTPALSGLVGEHSGGGDPELFTAEFEHVLVTSLDGETVRYARAPDHDKFYPHIELLAETEGRKTVQPILGWSKGTNLYIGAFSSNLERSFTLTNTAGWYTNKVTQEASPLGFFSAHAYFPAKGDRPASLLTSSSDGSVSQRPRYFSLYDLKKQAPIWEFRVPSTACSLCLLPADSGGDRLPDFIIGLRAPCNRWRMPNGLDDAHSHLFAVSHDGKVLWEWTNLAGGFTDVVPCLMEDKGEDAIVVRLTLTAEMSALMGSTETPEGALLKIGRDGSLISDYWHTNDLNTHLVTQLRTIGPPVVLATDSGGWLHCFDSDLRPIAHVPVAPGTNTWVTRSAPVPPNTNNWSMLELVGVEDLDGDGKVEVVLHAAQLEYRGAKSLGKPGDPGRDDVYRDWSVIVLDEQLRLLKKYTYAQKRPENLGTEVRLAKRPTLGLTEILILGDQVRPLRFVRK